MFEIYPSRRMFRREWRWRWVSPDNGYIVFQSSEGYRDIRDCEHSVNLAKGSSSSGVKYLAD